MKLGIAAIAAACLATVLIAGGMQATSGGYIASVRNATNTAGSAQAFTCATAIDQDKANAYFAYRLSDANNTTTATDLTGHNDNGTYYGTMKSTVTSPTACPRDVAGSGAYNPLGGTLNAQFVVASTAVTNPTTFSLEAWFRTSAKSGRIINLGTSNGALLTNSGLGSYDRSIYINSSGNLVFGMIASATLSTGSGATPKVVTDGNWHHVVVTVTAGTPVTAAASVSLYLDGALFSSGGLAAAGNYTGYWRIGWDSQLGWSGTGSNDFFNGNLRYVAAYSVALSSARVAAHYLAGVPK